MTWSLLFCSASSSLATCPLPDLIPGMPAVSVLVPCCNAAATLDVAFSSLARQTLADFEVIAVDDGSSDATRQLLQDWTKHDARFRIFHQAHAGITTALSFGLQACRAGIIARMDADDYAYPQRLECQLEYLRSNPPVDVVSCQVESFPDSETGTGLRLYLEWQNSLLSDEEIRREMFIESPLVHPSVMFRKEVVKCAGGYQENGWPEDYDLWLRLYCAGAVFARLPQVLLAWREHPQRLTRMDRRYSMENFMRARAHYLRRGPLAGCDAVYIWGAGMMGRRLGRALELGGGPLDVCVPLVAYVDIDPHKIGSTRRGLPVLSPPQLRERWKSDAHPVVLAAVGTRGARPEVRRRINDLGLIEGHDWWFSA
jgi:cellulose synthase/poly-beta-1,6-N-acetylglucosamine synthase-like glycosyltransferase